KVPAFGPSPAMARVVSLRSTPRAIAPLPSWDAGENVQEGVLADADAEDGDGVFRVARHGPGSLLWSAPRSTLGDCGEPRRSIPLGDLDTVQSADLKADMRLVGGRAQRYRPNAC